MIGLIQEIRTFAFWGAKPEAPAPLTGCARDTGPPIPSPGYPAGSMGLQPPKVYTGDPMLGIAQMHKSNAIPVFRKEDAVAVAHMRRKP